MSTPASHREYKYNPGCLPPTSKSLEDNYRDFKRDITPADAARPEYEILSLFDRCQISSGIRPPLDGAIPMSARESLEPLLEHPLLKGQLKNPSLTNHPEIIPPSVFFGRFQRLATVALVSEDENQHARYSVPTLIKLVPWAMHADLIKLLPTSWKILRTQFLHIARARMPVHVDHEEITRFFLSWNPPFCDEACTLKGTLRLLNDDINSASGRTYETSLRAALNGVQKAFPNLEWDLNQQYDKQICATFASTTDDAFDILYMAPPQVIPGGRITKLFKDHLLSGRFDILRPRMDKRTNNRKRNGKGNRKGNNKGTSNRKSTSNSG
ncbi:hypothetical protein CJU90_0595 [Yarrowia sp. C11]|nr:hypothetical protein CKK34_2006 [Yarrowia sp. E02]KAG5372934.1 hypothetical protein CJU90_0595 [Yarrowia sp. C11]